MNFPMFSLMALLAITLGLGAWFGIDQYLHRKRTRSHHPH